MNKKSVIFSALLLFSIFGWSQISLPKLISDGAILQRGTELKIWGWAAPNEAVTLNFNKATYETKADESGNWQLLIPKQKAGGPYEMEFMGTNKITLKNILIGDVWVCSGQSNMELTMNRLQDQYPEVIKKSKNNKIRQFLVPDKYDFNEPNKDFESGSWEEANPGNLLEFSGVAYFFAKDLYDRYNVPIGLINSALGGSPVEAWMSEDALEKFPESYDELQKFKDKKLIKEIEEKDKERQQSWYGELGSKDVGLIKGSEWFLPNTEDSDWEEMEVPNFWAEQGLSDVNGVVWFRKHVNVPNSMIGKETKLWLGRIVDQDHVYVNGEFLGTTGYQYPPRKYNVPSNLLKDGKNTITVRIINEQGKGGFVHDKPYFLAVDRDTINLIGKWKYRLGATMEPLAGPTFIRWKPGGLYNRMIAPLLNYKIRGVIWYQGESNTGNPDQYFDTFPAMINNWRDKWKIGNFPFLYVQLANFMEETEEPTESNWAALRQAQLETLAVPNTGMAVTTDLGEWNDIHPLNKKDVGQRLAQQAYKLAYGEKNSVLSPIPKIKIFLKKKVIIGFKNSKNGLISNNGKPLTYFEISNDGVNFFKAKAIIKGKKVHVWNENILHPTEVRYAWANNPKKANLFSKEGMPVSPFEVRD